MTAAELLQLRPESRSDLLIGPASCRATTELHPVKDPVSGARYELRTKEFFVLSRLDGQRSLGDIGQEYAERFGVRLGDRNWQQLLGLLYGRGLLVVDPHATAPARPAAPAAAPTTADRRSGVLSGHTRLVADAETLIDTLHRRTAFARNPVFLTALLVLVTGMLADLAVQAAIALHDLRELWHRPVLLLAVGVVLWVGLALHEIAHGLVGRAYGGTVTEIGLRWQLPVTYLYCLVRDMAFFARRRGQLATVAAGPAMSLVFLLPFWAAWLLVPQQGPAHYALGGLLLLGVGVAVGNLLPLPPLDGYKLLGYGLGTSQLATDSRRFLGLAAAAAIGRGAGVDGYTRRMRVVYGLYGLLSGLVLAGAPAAALAGAGLWLADRRGAVWGFLPALLVVLALLLRLTGISVRAKRELTARQQAAD